VACRILQKVILQKYYIKKSVIVRISMATRWQAVLFFMASTTGQRPKENINEHQRNEARHLGVDIMEISRQRLHRPKLAQLLSPRFKMHSTRAEMLAPASMITNDNQPMNKQQVFPALSLRARSLDIPTESHPNRMPFTGVLTKIDEPSDTAPEAAPGAESY
jgi:hypothetical protein